MPGLILGTGGAVVNETDKTLDYYGHSKGVKNMSYSPGPMAQCVGAPFHTLKRLWLRVWSPVRL